MAHITVLERFYLPDDVGDGEIDYRDETETVVYCTPEAEDDELTAVDYAVMELRDRGLMAFSCSEFTSHGWYSTEDGDYVTNYGTGERCEPSAHLYGFTEDELREIHKGVTE